MRVWTVETESDSADLANQGTFATAAHAVATFREHVAALAQAVGETETELREEGTGAVLTVTGEAEGEQATVTLTGEDATADDWQTLHRLV